MGRIWEKGHFGELISSRGKELSDLRKNGMLKKFCKLEVKIAKVVEMIAFWTGKTLPK